MVKSKSITVVEGFHYLKGKCGASKPWLNISKPYNFRVNSRTRYKTRLKPGRLCIVSTARGKRYLFVVKVYSVTGSIAMKFASHLKPVLKCGLFGPKIKHFYDLINKKTKFHVTFHKRTKAWMRELNIKDMRNRSVKKLKAIRSNQN